MNTWLKIVIRVGLAVGLVVLVLYVFFFDVWTVPKDDPLLSASIEPTLSAGDVILVTRRTSVGRGNLLRCADPQVAGRFVVARAIARSGDHFAMSGETVTIDGQRTPSPRACDPAVVTVHNPASNEDNELVCSVEEYGEISFSVLRSQDHPEPPIKATVDGERWYLVSDDRHVHLDSRDYGSIDPSTCQHVVFRLAGGSGFGDSQHRLNIIW